MAKIADLYADIRANTSGLQKGLNDAKSWLKGFGDDVKGAEGSSVDSFMSIVGAVSKVTAAIIAAKKVYDFSAEGAQIASLEMASYKLAKSYGANMRDIVVSLKDASFNTISEYEAMKSANLAMTMGVTANADEIGNLLQIAMMRARAFGLTTEEAFNRITVGIGRRSIKVLDDLGFNIVGATSVQDLFNKVLEQGNKELADMGGLAVDVSTGYQRVSTVYKDFMNEVKMNAGYGFMPFVTSPEETREINKQRADLALLTGSYKDYLAAKYAEMGVGGVTGPKNLDVRIMTEREFAIELAMRAKNEAYRENIAVQEELTESNQTYNTELHLQAGLSNDVANAQARYSAEMEKAGRNTTKQAAALDNLNESYEDFILSTMGDLGASSEATMGVAYAFGEIDDSSVAVFSAIKGIVDLGLGAVETANRMVALNGRIQDLNDVQLADKSMTIRVNYLISGWFGAFPGMTRVGTSKQGVGGGPSAIESEFKHGGTVYGGIHGMIVPPGFSNDGMPVMVSSGERLDVTPAGNKGGGDIELAGLIADLKYTMEGLPRIIRDAVQMA